MSEMTLTELRSAIAEARGYKLVQNGVAWTNVIGAEGRASMSAVKERPIVYSGPMVRALLAGRKTQTRRTRGLKAINEDPDNWQFNGFWGAEVKGQPVPLAHFINKDGNEKLIKCPYGVAGDWLWVRETFVELWKWDQSKSNKPEWYDEEGNCKPGTVYYRADNAISEMYDYDGTVVDVNWRPSIHMPRWASRINHEITRVRVERAHDVSDVDAIAEGVVVSHPVDTPLVAPVHSYRSLWIKINGRASWESNPWAWVIGFKAVEEEASYKN